MPLSLGRYHASGAAGGYQCEINEVTIIIKKNVRRACAEFIPAASRLDVSK